MRNKINLLYLLKSKQSYYLNKNSKSISLNRSILISTTTKNYSFSITSSFNFCDTIKKTNNSENIKSGNNNDLNVNDNIEEDITKFKVKNLNEYNRITDILQKKQRKKDKFDAIKKKLFWIISISSCLFSIWVASGFYDIVPKFNIEDRIEEYRARKKLETQIKHQELSKSSSNK